MKQNILLYGGIDKQNSILKEGNYVDAINLINSSRDSDKNQKLHVVLGNSEIEFDRDFEGRNIVIGACPDEATQSIYIFVWNEEDNHHILRVNTDGSPVDKIVYPDGVNALLNTDSLGFVEEPEIFSAVAIDGMLIWTTGGPIRMVDVEKAYNLSNNLPFIPNAEKYFSFAGNQFLLERNPPKLPIFAQYERDENYSKNNLRGRLFQFAYRYVYHNNEVSVLSEYSNVPLPIGQETYEGEFIEDVFHNNVIVFSVDSGGYDVKKIEIFARELNIIPDADAVTGGWYKIKEIDRFDEDGNYVNDPNVFNIYFYNDVIKIREDQAEMSRLFDFVPREARTLELIEGNRLIVGDYLEGYDVIDTDISLSITQQTFSATQLEEELSSGIQVQELDPGDINAWIPPTVYAYGFFKLPLAVTENDTIDISLTQDAITYTNTHVVTAAEANDVNYPSILKANITAGISASGIDIPASGVIATIHESDFYVTFFEYEGDEITTGYLSTLNWAIGDIIYNGSGNNYKRKNWKKGAYHQFGIVYKDDLKRRSSVIVNDSMKVYIPFDSEEPYVGNTYERKKYEINYEINHAAPDWATTYSWVYFPESTITDFYQFYYKVNAVAGVSSSTIVEDNDIRKDEDGRFRIRVNNALNAQRERFNSLLSNYEWQKGDRIRIIGYFGSVGALYYLNKIKDFEIIGHEYNDDQGGTGYYEIIISSGLDLSPNYFNNPYPSAPKYVFYEIYRPSLAMEDKLGYEIETFAVVDGKHYGYTQDQTASLPCTGTFQSGNSYFFTRACAFEGSTTEFYMLTESKHFSDYYPSDAYNYGKINAASESIREKRYLAGLRYSEQLIQGTLINGLSTWLYLSFNNLEEQFGSITHLEGIGDSIKVRQQYKSTSFYIGRQFLKTASGQDIPVESVDRILGGKLTSEEPYGLQHPRSYARNGRHEYFFDVRNGQVIRDSSNGMFPISSYGMSDYWRDMAKLIMEDDYQVIGGYDRVLDCYIITIMNGVTTATKTWMFSEKDNQWKGQLTHFNPSHGVISHPPHGGDGHDAEHGPCRPEIYASIGDKFFSFIKGHIFEHNVGNPAKFYNHYHAPEVTVRWSGNMIDPVQFRTIEYSSDIEWNAPDDGDVMVPVSSTSREMQSRIKSFRKMNTKWHAPFLRNACTTSSTPSQEDLFNGDFLRGLQLEVRLVAVTEDRGWIGSVSINVL